MLGAFVSKPGQGVDGYRKGHKSTHALEYFWENQ